MLTDVTLAGNVAGLFYKGVDPTNREHMVACETAFKNITLHYCEKLWPGPDVLNLIQFDDVKLHMMLQRFYRDAWGVYRLHNELKRICPDEAMRDRILHAMERQSIRINSPDPLKTRIAAVFSLWMATFRPIYLKSRPPAKVKNVWCLDAAVNFLIVRRYLRFFGEIQVGSPGKDRDNRLKRILYDFTVRNINLSSLEMLYSSIFRPVAEEVEQPERVYA